MLDLRQYPRRYRWTPKEEQRKSEDLFERLERVEDELLESIEADPRLIKAAGVMDLMGQMKVALRSMTTARDAFRRQAQSKPIRSRS